MWVVFCDGFCSGGSSGSSRISSFFCSLCSSVCDSSCGSSFFSISFPASGCLGASLLPSAPFPWPVSLAHALGSYLVVRGFHGCFRVLPLLCYTLSPVSALRCCPLHQLSLCFALLSRAPLRVHLALPLLPQSPLLALVAPLLSLVLLLSFLRCLGLLRLLPSSSLSVWLRSCCPFAPGLLV